MTIELTPFRCILVKAQVYADSTLGVTNCNDRFIEERVS